MTLSILSVALTAAAGPMVVELQASHILVWLAMHVLVYMALKKGGFETVK